MDDKIIYIGKFLLRFGMPAFKNKNKIRVGNNNTGIVIYLCGYVLEIRKRFQYWK